MCEVTLHDTPEAFRIQLSGELTQASVPEVALCWQTGSSTLGERRLVVDLTGLASMDDAGRDLLESMSRAGAEFIATSAAPRRARLASFKRFLALVLCPILRCPAQRDAD